jgi:hypothetical protein
MPTASNELREKMRQRFGSEIDEQGPLKYLKDRGFTEVMNGMLQPPKTDYMITTEEWECVEFLCDEWDFAYEPELPL